MLLPIDVSDLKLTAASPARQDGRGRWMLRVSVWDERLQESEQVQVAVPADPKVVAGDPLRVEGLASSTTRLVADAVRVGMLEVRHQEAS